MMDAIDHIVNDGAVAAAASTSPSRRSSTTAARRSSSEDEDSNSSSPGLRRRRNPSSPPSSSSSSSNPPSPTTEGIGVDDDGFVSDDGEDDEFGGDGDDAARRMRQRRETSRRADDDIDHHKGDDHVDGGIDRHRHQPQQQQQQQQQQQRLLPHREFWRNYDTVIMLSICSVVGIFIRMMSATWFRLELGAVFSEDSALGTNLPLNVWSCFLLGLLCSGRDAMGIVHSRVFSGGGDGGSYGGSRGYYGNGGIFHAGMGACRNVIDAGRARMNRARRRRGGGERGGSRDDGDIEFDSSSTLSEIEDGGNATTTTRRGRRRDGHDVVDRDLDERVADTSNVGPSPPPPLSSRIDRAVASEYSESIAGLLGLDDEFRIVGEGGGASDDVKIGEDEIRQVQLHGLSRRIMASPSIAFFPARKEVNDVL